MVDVVDALGRMTQAAYARRRHVSRQRINRLVKDQIIPLHDGRIDPVEADQLIAEMAHGSFEHNRKMLPLTVDALPPAPPSRGENAVKEEAGATDHTRHETHAVPGDSEDCSTDAEDVDQIYQHLKDLIFNSRNMKDVPHVEIKKLNEFIAAVQKKREMDEKARTLIPMQEAQNRFVQVAGQVREGFLNVANKIAGSTAAKAMELLRQALPTESHKALETLMQDKRWEDLFHRTIHREITEVLRAFDHTTDLLRES